MQPCIIYAYEDDCNDNENYKNFSIEKMKIIKVQILVFQINIYSYEI